MTARISDILFDPGSIVIYGASSDPDKLSGRPLAYLKKFGYKGEIYAVNPRREQVQGVRCYADIESVPGTVDLAVIVVPAESVQAAVQRCSAAGVLAAIVFASGFGEIGEGGRSAQEALGRLARESGMRLLGPNCLGSFASLSRAFATFSTAFDDDSSARTDAPVALVTQSGAVGTFTYSMMANLGVGVRYFANTGNEADITSVELLSELAERDDVKLLLGHLEAGTNLDGLERLVQAADRHAKPLLVLKGGRTDPGARAIAAHTGSEAGPDDRIDGLLTAGGAIRLFSMEAMADAAILFAAGRRARGARISIVTLSGGAGALATDAAVDAGLVVGPPSKGVRHALAGELPYYGSTTNPIDMTGSMINDIGILKRALAITAGNGETDSILVAMGNADKDADEIVEVLRDAYSATDKPFAVSWTGGSGRPLRCLTESGIPAYPDPARAVTAMANLTRFSLRQVAGASDSPGRMCDPEAPDR